MSCGLKQEDLTAQTFRASVQQLNFRMVLQHITMQYRNEWLTSLCRDGYIHGRARCSIRGRHSAMLCSALHVHPGKINPPSAP